MNTHTSRILILEDDEDLRVGLSFALRQEGYALDVAETIAAAREHLSTRSFDLLLLDVMLPDGSGFDLCRDLRSGRVSGSAQPTSVDVPIVFLTARDDEIDVIQGLEIGADDYIAKPFRLRELLSRVKVRLRRAAAAPSDGPGGSGPIRVDVKRAEVLKREEPVALTAAEYRLFLALVQHSGQTLTRDQLADRVMAMDDAVVDDNTVSVYIRRLREKLEDDPADPKLIVTVCGIGYRYEARS